MIESINQEISNSTLTTKRGISFAHQEIADVVQKFYLKLQRNDDFKIFNQSVTDMDLHIKRLTHFWWVQLGGKAYQNEVFNPVGINFHKIFNDMLMLKWKAAFKAVQKENLTPTQADEWGKVTDQMLETLINMNEIFKTKFEVKN